MRRRRGLLAGRRRACWRPRIGIRLYSAFGRAVSTSQLPMKTAFPLALLLLLLAQQLGCASCDEWEGEGEDELEEEEDDDEMVVEEAPTSGGQPGQQRGAPPPWASDPEVRVRPLPSRRHCAGHYARVRASR